MRVNLFLHEQTLNVDVRQLQAFDFVRELFVASQEYDFLDETLILQVVQGGCVPIVVCA